MGLFLLDISMFYRGGYATESAYENVGSTGDMEEIMTTYVEAGMAPPLSEHYKN
jgi:hypothetical protein